MRDEEVNVYLFGYFLLLVVGGLIGPAILLAVR